MSKLYKLQVEENEYINHEDYKQLCMYVYHNGVPLTKGYEVLDIAIDPENGFYAEVVRKGNNVVIVSRGTEDFNDIRNDIAMMRGHTPSQYYSLMATYNEVLKLKEYNPNIKITFIGHSLTGSISQLASATTGEDAVTFAPFGAEGLLPKDVKKVASKIINYGNEDDEIFTYRLNQQMGEIRIIQHINDILPHKLQSWGKLNDYITYTKKENSHTTIKDIEEIKEKRYFTNKMKQKPTGFASDIRNFSEPRRDYEIIYPSDIRYYSSSAKDNKH